MLVATRTLSCVNGESKGYSVGQASGGIELADCELLRKCPFFHDELGYVSEMTDMDRERYCRGDYIWCGRYLIFKALQGELERTHPFLERGDK